MEKHTISALDKLEKVTNARDIAKVSIKKEYIYDVIKDHHLTACHKHAIPNHIYVSPSVISEIINDGFKVYKGNLHGFIDALIIEW